MRTIELSPIRDSAHLHDFLTRVHSSENINGGDWQVRTSKLAILHARLQSDLDSKTVSAPLLALKRLANANKAEKAVLLSKADIKEPLKHGLELLGDEICRVKCAFGEIMFTVFGLFNKEGVLVVFLQQHCLADVVSLCTRNDKLMKFESYATFGPPQVHTPGLKTEKKEFSRAGPGPKIAPVTSNFLAVSDLNTYSLRMSQSSVISDTIDQANNLRSELTRVQTIFNTKLSGLALENEMLVKEAREASQREQSCRKQQRVAEGSYKTLETKLEAEKKQRNLAEDSKALFSKQLETALAENKDYKSELDHLKLIKDKRDEQFANFMSTIEEYQLRIQKLTEEKLLLKEKLSEYNQLIKRLMKEAEMVTKLKTEQLTGRAALAPSGGLLDQIKSKFSQREQETSMKNNQISNYVKLREQISELNIRSEKRLDFSNPVTTVAEVKPHPQITPFDPMSSFPSLLSPIGTAGSVSLDSKTELLLCKVLGILQGLNPSAPRFQVSSPMSLIAFLAYVYQCIDKENFKNTANSIRRLN